VMGVSRHQLRRLEALRQKLAEQGFMLQQVRRCACVWDGNPGEGCHQTRRRGLSATRSAE
jgi:hypothetical protein